MAIRIGNKEFSPEAVQDMIDAGLLGAGAKHDTSASTPNATPPHGPFPGNSAQFGIFSDAGVRPGMWNATARVRGVGQHIPMEKSVYMNELIDVATGVTAGSGNNVTSACAVGPKPGQLKKAQIAATFGIVHISTKIFDITQAGMRRNRADIDRQTFNNAAATNPWLPQVPGIDGAQFVNSTLRAELFALGIELERNIGQVHFLGIAGTENNTYRGVARQWNGLDRLVRTGWQDASSGVAVPRLDAAVTPFNASISGNDASGRSVIRAVNETFYGQDDFLDQLGIVPSFALVMRADLFRELAAVWACGFSTDRCAGSAGNPVQRDAMVTYQAFLNMLRGRYLTLEGMDIPVIIDDSIPRDTLGNNYFKSDIYGLALSGNGIPTLYGEYFDMDNADANEIATAFGIQDGTTTTVNNGMYRVFKRVTGGCVEYDFFARPRLITDAPFMHFRIDDVFYNSFVSNNDPIPGFSYYKNGGLTYAG